MGKWEEKDAPPHLQMHSVSLAQLLAATDCWGCIHFVRIFNFSHFLTKNLNMYFELFIFFSTITQACYKVLETTTEHAKESNKTLNPTSETIFEVWK